MVGLSGSLYTILGKIFAAHLVDLHLQDAFLTVKQLVNYSGMFITIWYLKKTLCNKFLCIIFALVMMSLYKRLLELLQMPSYAALIHTWSTGVFTCLYAIALCSLIMGWPKSSLIVCIWSHLLLHSLKFIIPNLSSVVTLGLPVMWAIGVMLRSGTSSLFEDT